MDRYEGRKKLKYRYYQTPDGEEYGQKLWWMVRPAIDYGLFLAGTDVLAITKPEGWFPLIERFTRVFVRPIVTCVIFETTVYVATHLRKKDDGFNHVFGGLACGYYWHRFIGVPPISGALTILACIALYNFKQQKMMGVQLHFEPDADHDGDYGAWTRFNNWSGSTKYPRTWLTAEEAVAKGIQV